MKFLSLSYVGPLSCGVSLIGSILVQVGTDLGDTTIIAWILSAGGITSSVSLTIAGQASDIFGRRWTVLGGQLLCLVGFVSTRSRGSCVNKLTALEIVAATAKKTYEVVVGQTINGLGTGFVFTSYAGIAEMLPNRWR